MPVQTKPPQTSLPGVPPLMRTVLPLASPGPCNRRTGFIGAADAAAAEQYGIAVYRTGAAFHVTAHDAAQVPALDDDGIVVGTARVAVTAVDEASSLSVPMVPPVTRTVLLRAAALRLSPPMTFMRTVPPLTVTSLPTASPRAL